MGQTNIPAENDEKDGEWLRGGGLERRFKKNVAEEFVYANSVARRSRFNQSRLDCISSFCHCVSSVCVERQDLLANFEIGRCCRWRCSFDYPRICVDERLMRRLRSYLLIVIYSIASLQTTFSNYVPRFTDGFPRSPCRSFWS